MEGIMEERWTGIGGKSLWSIRSIPEVFVIPMETESET